MIPILQMAKLRLREMKSLVWGCTGNKEVRAGRESRKNTPAPCSPCSPHLAGGSAGRQSPPGGWSWHSPSRHWKGREGWAFRMPVHLIMGKSPGGQKTTTMDPSTLLTRTHLSATSVSVFPNSISPFSGLSTLILGGLSLGYPKSMWLRLTPHILQSRTLGMVT